MPKQFVLPAEALFLLQCLRAGEVSELLDLLDHPSSEGLVEVALEALTSPGGDLKAAIAAVIRYCENRDLR